MAHTDPAPLGDDDDLFAALADALATARHPQSRLIIANASDAFGLARLEEEVAALVYDSLLEPTGSRAVEGSRFVVFETESLSIEIEIVGEVAVGQIAPPGDFAITVERPGEEWLTLQTDDLGCFSFDLPRPEPGAGPRQPLRFRVTHNRTITFTEWTSLPPQPS